MQLKQPDRVPLIMSVGYLLADLGGITKQELLENPEKAQHLLEKAALEFQPDSIHGPMPADPTPHLILGDRMTVWPGHGVDVNSQFQFVESEFMKEDEYDAFLDDPTDWVIRKYLPRAFSALDAFASMPPLSLFVSGSYYLGTMGRLASGGLADSLQGLRPGRPGRRRQHRAAEEEPRAHGGPGLPRSLPGRAHDNRPLRHAVGRLRGMRGIMMDIIRQPDKLIAAQEKLIRFELDFAIDTCKATGINRTFLPLHRGSDGFMSLKQFETLYWKQLKEVLVTLVENGITPIVFYEGCWDQRLEYLAELPKGKTVGMFQASDIFKVKEVIGDTMCIVGGMPNSLLKGGHAR